MILHLLEAMKPFPKKASLTPNNWYSFCVDHDITTKMHGGHMLLIAWFGFATLLCWAIAQRATERSLPEEVEMPQSSLTEFLDLR